MTYEIYTLKNEVYEEISKIKNVINISWNDDLNNIFTSFEFTSSEELEGGAWVKIKEKYDDKTVLIGVITQTSCSKKGIYNYSGYDIGFYAEKNKITKQFKTNTSISDAIKIAAAEAQIPCGELPIIPYTVKKIYKNTSVSDILKELLNFAIEKGLQNNLYFDCKNGFINLSGYSENDNLKGYIANLYTLKSTDTIHSFNITSSIEEMKNRVLVITSESENGNITKVNKEYTASDDKSIQQYGLLQEIIEPQKEEKNYKQLAENKLKELDNIKNEISLTVLADYKAQKGVIIPIKNDYLNLNDKYLIKSSRHSIEGAKEIVTINVKKYTG